MNALPELQTALLTPDSLDALFADIAAHTELLAVLRKDGVEQRADLTALSLDAAKDALTADADSAQPCAIQLRYRHAGIEWWDTLRRVPEGVKLVRISHT